MEATAIPTAIVSCVKRPPRRQITAQGHVITNGGEWEIIMSDGRTFVHGTKTIAQKIAGIYAKGGEFAVTEFNAR